MRENNLWQSVAISQAEKNVTFLGGVSLLQFALKPWREGGREALLGGNIKMWETQRYKSAAVAGGKGFHILPFPADLRGKLECSYFPYNISNILIRNIRKMSLSLCFCKPCFLQK